MPKSAYLKPAIPIADQLSILEDRGLTIGDANRAAHYLRFIGYYRLSGYYRYYADPQDASNKRFRAGTRFEYILNLYIFDRKLRVLLMDALERIEIALKAIMANECALLKGPFWLSDPGNFDYNKHPAVIAVIEECLGEDVEESPHPFIRHFFATYTGDHPPCWMIFEALSFGAVSNIFKRMKGALRAPIGASLNLHPNMLESWLHSLVVLRNVCAHNGRVWNRHFPIRPSIPHRYAQYWPYPSQDRLYILCGMIQLIMKTIADGSEWATRLRQLINERPDVPLGEMGFPNDWESSELWAFPQADPST